MKTRRMAAAGCAAALSLVLAAEAPSWGAESRRPAPRDERITPAEAGRHVGAIKTVCGKVVSAAHDEKTAGEPTFLNLDQPYPDHIFTVVIWGKDRARFEPPPEVAYRGKAICVTGTIELYHGKPEITVRRRSQIEVIEAAEPPAG